MHYMVLVFLNFMIILKRQKNSKMKCYKLAVGQWRSSERKNIIQCNAFRISMSSGTFRQIRSAFKQVETSLQSCK
jgi:hypothetical protein